MTSFQIISIILAGVGLLGGLIGLFFRSAIQLTKLETEINFIKKQLDENRSDHISITEKLDQVLSQIKK